MPTQHDPSKLTERPKQDHRSPEATRERTFVNDPPMVADLNSRFVDRTSLPTEDEIDMEEQARFLAVFRLSGEFRQGLLELEKTSAIQDLKRVLAQSKDSLVVLAVPDTHLGNEHGRALLKLDGKGFSVSHSSTKTVGGDSESVIRAREEKPRQHYLSSLLPSRRILAGDLHPFIEHGATLNHVVRSLGPQFEAGASEGLGRSLQELAVDKRVIGHPSPSLAQE